METHNDKHAFVVFKSPVRILVLIESEAPFHHMSIDRHEHSEVRVFCLTLKMALTTLCRQYADVENPSQSPPLIPYPIYT